MSEQTKEMSDEQLGRALAEAVGWKTVYKNYYRSPKFHQNYFFKLCQSLDAIREIEEIVIEKTKGEYDSNGAYFTALCEAVRPSCKFGIVGDVRMAMATARERAEACLAALAALREEG